MMGRLEGKAKIFAGSIPVKRICQNDGVDLILTQLDKTYALEGTLQLGTDVASLLDYGWAKNIYVGQFIAGFHARIDRVFSLNLHAKLKEHILLH